jgi:Lrp/AsnC family leucine-responsive transcriptional regulator
MNEIDYALLSQLRTDAGRSYAELGQAVGLSPAAAHERVRKLRASGTIRGTTIDINPESLGRGVLAFVHIEANAWMGGCGPDLVAIPEIEEAHIVAGQTSVLAKVRTASTLHLQVVLRRIFDIPGVTGTQATVVLEPLFERGIQIGTSPSTP